MAKDGKKTREEPSGGVLKVVRDEELQRDLEAAHQRTGIRSEAELLRYALRQVARGDVLSPWTLPGYASGLRRPAGSCDRSGAD